MTATLETRPRPVSSKSNWRGAGKRTAAHGDRHLTEQPTGDMPDLGQPIEVTRLDTATLHSAGELYQRPVDLPYVHYLVDQWDWDAFRTLLVNQRPDGSYWLVDGQHRVLAIREKFGRDLVVWCYVVHLPGPEQEAELYERVSGSHNKLNPTVLFRGRLTRREPIAVDIDRIVQDEGYALALLGKPESEYQLAIPAVLDRIYKQHGPERLREILAFCRDCWGGQRGFSSSHCVTGVAKLYEYFSDCKAWDRDRVVEILAAVPLEDAAKEGKKVIGEFGYHRHVAFAVALQRLYNARVPGGKRARLFRKGEA